MTTKAIQIVKGAGERNEKRQREAAMSVRLFICDMHDNSPEQRDNCGACALKGYRRNGAEIAHDTINYSGWARDYVQAQRGIPKRFIPGFVRELLSDNRAYADALREDIVYFGLWMEM